MARGQEQMPAPLAHPVVEMEEPAFACWLPGKAFGSNWSVRLDTHTGAVDPVDAKPWKARTKHSIQPHSMVVLSTSVVPEEERKASRTRAARAGTTIARSSQQS